MRAFKLVQVGKRSRKWIYLLFKVKLNFKGKKIREEFDAYEALV